MNQNVPDAVDEFLLTGRIDLGVLNEVLRTALLILLLYQLARVLRHKSKKEKIPEGTMRDLRGIMIVIILYIICSWCVKWMI